MRQSNINATSPIEYRLVLKNNIEKSISLKPTKASTANHIDKPTPRGKTFGIDPDIRFY